MEWAEKRRRIIETILVLCAVAFLAIVVIATTYRSPSCTDNTQNQGEAGVDCGGPCSYLCKASETAPTVRFVHAVSPEPGRTDVIAYVDNANSNASIENAQYTLELYGPTEALIARKQGTITIPPSTTMPLYVPGIYSGTETVSQAFLTFNSDTLKWLRTDAKSIVPIPTNIQISEGQTPKITATLTNPTAHALYAVTVVATVFNAAGNAIAASQTVVPSIAGQGTAALVFTWNAPFSDTPARVEILPATPISP